MSQPQTVTRIRINVDLSDLAAIMGMEPIPDGQEAELLNQLASHYERELVSTFPGADIEVGTDHTYGGAAFGGAIESSDGDDWEANDLMQRAFDAAVQTFLDELEVEA